MRIHYAPDYIINPQHKVTISLVGLGGTGSQVLTLLARMNEALVALQHPGIHVRAWDDDIVTEANVGRQLYSPADVGQNKAVCLVTRINRFFGYNWEAYAEKFGSDTPGSANIVITCVDTAKARIDIGKAIGKNKTGEPHGHPYYWLDFGNMQRTGQVVLGTIAAIRQPKSQYKTAGALPKVIKKFPQLSKINEVDQGPSCSLAEALGKQDLYINSTLANLGINILWKLFREAVLTYHGCFLNLDTMSVNPIKV